VCTLTLWIKHVTCVKAHVMLNVVNYNVIKLNNNNIVHTKYNPINNRIDTTIIVNSEFKMYL